MMGAKPSNNMQSDRPESGGADKDMLREKSGLLDRDKTRFANERAEERTEASRSQRDASDEDRPGAPSEFSIDNPRNPDPNNK
jgi:hypothetical protein